MGNICCKRKAKKNIVLLLVGLDNAGKTVAARGLAGDSLDSVVPTVGFSIINLNHLQYKVKIFDLGGGAGIRGIWHRYFVDAHGVIFVIDSSDTSRLDEAKEIFQNLLSHKKITGKPILLLANKQDNKNALDEIDVIEKLDVEKIVNDNECPTLVQSCCATEEINAHSNMDDGIKKGYDWLINYVIRNYERINERVEDDVTMQTIAEKRSRLELVEKMKKRKLEEEIKQTRTENEDAIESYSDYKRKIDGQAENNSNDEAIMTKIGPIVLERPKSASQIVRKHLQLEKNNRKKTIFVSIASNKTAPMELYGTDLARTVSAKRRNLKSAGDAPFAESSKNQFGELMQLDGNLASLNLENGQNGMAWATRTSFSATSFKF